MDIIEKVNNECEFINSLISEENNKIILVDQIIKNNKEKRKACRQLEKEIIRESKYAIKLMNRMSKQRKLIEVLKNKLFSKIIKNDKKIHEARVAGRLLLLIKYFI